MTKTNGELVYSFEQLKATNTKIVKTLQDETNALGR